MIGRKENKCSSHKNTNINYICAHAQKFLSYEWERDMSILRVHADLQTGKRGGGDNDAR